MAGCARREGLRSETSGASASPPKNAASEANPTSTPPKEEKTPVKQKTFVYKRVGELSNHAEVFYDTESPAPRPVIVSIHGGALMGGWRMTKLDRMSEIFVDAGYVVVSIDYRLAPETKLPEIVADVRDAHQWVRAEGPALFGADPNRLATLGGSAGGYLTLVSGYVVQPRPRALVSFYGYGDILGKWYTEPDAYYRSLKEGLIAEEQARSVVGTTPITRPPRGMEIPRLKFYEYCRQQGLWPNEVMGLDPRRHEDAFTPYMPIRNVTRDYPPTLLLHGQKDTDVPYEQSVLMAEELSRAGVEHELVLYPEGFHGFEVFWQAKQFRKDAEDAFDRAFRFVEKHMK